MEKILVEKIEVTQADYAALMQERAAKVQAYLLQTGKVTVDRVTVATSPQGQSRANLSLQ